LDKTGNKWEERHAFKKIPSKYFPLEVEEDEEEDEEDELDARFQSVLPSFLNPKVKKVVEMIFDVSMIKNQLSQLKIDVAKFPLGKLKTSHIKEGYAILKKIEETLSQTGESKKFQLISLSNQFYTLIPTDFGKNKVQPIDSSALLEEKMKQMNALLDIQVASSLLHQNKPISSVHPTVSYLPFFLNLIRAFSGSTLQRARL